MELTLIDTDFIAWQDPEDLEPEQKEPKPDEKKEPKTDPVFKDALKVKQAQIVDLMNEVIDELQPSLVRLKMTRLRNEMRRTCLKKGQSQTAATDNVQSGRSADSRIENFKQSFAERTRSF